MTDIYHKIAHTNDKPPFPSWYIRLNHLSVIAIVINTQHNILFHWRCLRNQLYERIYGLQMLFKRFKTNKKIIFFIYCTYRKMLFLKCAFLCLVSLQCIHYCSIVRHASESKNMFILSLFSYHAKHKLLRTGFIRLYHGNNTNLNNWM